MKRSDWKRRPKVKVPPIVAHVEVGGTLGGSLVCMDSYLRRCERQRFQHEALFYRSPRDTTALAGCPWPVTDLRLSPPSKSYAIEGRARRSARAFLSRHRRIEAAVSVARGAWELLASLPKALRLAQTFRHGGYTLVHCNNNFDYQIPTLLGALFARKRIVTHFRTPRKLSLRHRLVARIPWCIVAINNVVAADLKRQGVRTPIIVCHDPCERPQPSAENAAILRGKLLGEDGALLIGTISRLEQHKGIDDLLVAAHTLRTRWPQVHYVIVGTGSKMDALKRLAADRNLLDRTHFLGYQANAFDYLACCDVIVSPSRLEGGPLVVLEAMMMGLPVVSTDVGMVSEWMRSGQDGLIVPPNDPLALASAIESLLLDSSLRRSIGEHAAARAAALGDPVASARSLDEVFASAVLSRRR